MVARVTSYPGCSANAGRREAGIYPARFPRPWDESLAHPGNKQPGPPIGAAQSTILSYNAIVDALRRLFKSRHFWGLTGTAVVLCLLLFFARNLNVGWMMPDTQRLAREIINVWPQMPFFAVTKEPAKDGQGEIIYYTVPTRQLTPQELAQLGMTNTTTHPAEPK